MSPILVCAVILTAPPIETAAPPAKPPLRTADALRDDYRALMRQTAPGQSPDPGDVAPRLCTLYAELGDADTLPPREASRLRSGLELRMRQIQVRLLRDVQRGRDDRRRAAGAGTAREHAAGGGGPFAAQALQLVELIQTTIEPDSWQARGGQGTIHYYGVPQPVLVIRQTAEVHHQIGSVLSQLRR